MPFDSSIKTTELFNNYDNKEVSARFNFMKQIAIGLQFMNVNGFIHQDIKAENICVTPHKVEETLEYTIKIIDFGLAGEPPNYRFREVRKRFLIQLM